MHMGQEARGTVADGPRETRFVDISRDVRFVDISGEPRLVDTPRGGRS